MGPRKKPMTKDDDEESIITETGTEDQTILQSIADLAALLGANHIELKKEIQTLRGELTKTINGHTEDIKRLDKDVMDIKKDLMQIKNEQNEKEQRMRNYSIRISGYKLPETTLKDPIQTINAVYDAVIKPILQRALDNEEIAQVPDDPLQIIEFGHGLKNNRTAVPQIIMRFNTRAHRSLIFRHKKVALSILEATLGKVWISEDLTPATFKKMRTLTDEYERVSKAFTLGGKIKYILADDETNTIRTLHNLYDVPDEL